MGLNAGVSPEMLSLHGNNKGRNELELAIEAGIGKIIVDNEDEIALLEELTADRDQPITVLLRLNPGVDVHTHKKISTGMADSKFGLPIANGSGGGLRSRNYGPSRSPSRWLSRPCWQSTF